MNLPFTVDEFLQTFARYNLAIWPMQIVAYLLGIAAIVLSQWHTSYSGRVVSGILAFFWLWMAIAYHWLFFREINGAAAVFAFAFIVQGILFFVVGALRGDLDFRARTSPIGAVGASFGGYALLVYPIIGALAGHTYPQSPVFGVAPCPTTIFTFGLLLWTVARVPAYLLIIPLLWSLVGFAAAVGLGIYEDFGLVIAGLVGTALLCWRDCLSASAQRWRQRHA